MTLARIAAALAVAAAASTAAPACIAADAGFDALVKDWYADDFRAHPLDADYAGFHDWDDKIDDVSPAAREAERKRLHAWLKKFESLDPTPLDPIQRDDRAVVVADIKAALLEEEDIQAWRKDPSVYSGLAVECVFQTVKRDYAPLARRMGFAIAREKLIPAMLATAKTVIRNPPRIYVEIALENIDGALGFLKNSLPDAFKSVRDPMLAKDFAASNEAAIAALEDYKGWLRALLPSANGDFALGARNFSRKLAYEEMIDVPLDRLLAIGRAQLEKDRKALAAAARRIDPAKSVAAVVSDIEKDHPAGDALVSTARDQLEALRQFIVDRKLVPLPPETMPVVAATPKFEQALIEAETDAPGPYEKSATEAFYFVTPPPAGMSAAETESYLDGFGFAMLNNISAHEVFPGHFVHLMDIRALSNLSMVRRLNGTRTDVEGWAHYCEQMILDEGFGNGDPKLRVAQLMDALLRDVRYVAGIEMHTRGMSVEQATDMFVKDAYQPRPIASKEAKRGTSDPTYLYYTVGKLEILKLRDDWKAKMGAAYSLGEFHRRLIAAGTVPLKIIRREMMGADGPLL